MQVKGTKRFDLIFPEQLDGPKRLICLSFVEPKPKLPEPPISAKKNIRSPFEHKAKKKKTGSVSVKKNVTGHVLFTFLSTSRLRGWQTFLKAIPMQK